MSQLTPRISSPNPDLLTKLVQQAPLAESTKIKYTRAVQHAIDAGVDLTDSQQVRDYATTLKKSPKSHLKSVLKLWGQAIESQVKGQATSNNALAVQTTLYRTDVPERSHPG